MKRILSTLLLLMLLAAPAFAGKYDFTFNTSLTNDVFKDVVKEAGMLAAYRGVAPAEPQGITGFDVGVEASFIKLDTEQWDYVMDGDAPSTIGIPKLHIRKGLPFGLDFGVSYAAVPASNIKVLGGEVQYALMDGSAIAPALALRGHYSQLMGVDDLDLKTYGGDLVMSKGLLIFTPYVGMGVVQVEGKYTGDDATLKANLDDQSVTQPRVFVGTQIALALLRLTLDAEFSEVPVYTAKVSLGW